MGLTQDLSDGLGRFKSLNPVIFGTSRTLGG